MFFQVKSVCTNILIIKKFTLRLLTEIFFLGLRLSDLLLRFVAIAPSFASYPRNIVESIFQIGGVLFVSEVSISFLRRYMHNSTCNNEWTVNNRAMPSIGFKGFGLVMAASSPRSWAWLRRGHIYFLARVIHLGNLLPLRF